MYTLRPDQQKAVEKAIRFLSSATKGQSLLFQSPTGSGKSYCEAEVLLRRGPRFHHQIVPTIEIAQGIARKLYPDFNAGDSLSEALIRKFTETRGIYTAGVYKNKLMKGELTLPQSLSFDEAHHTEARTYEGIWDLCGRPPRIGFTATTYRGTPAGTKDLLDAWGRNIEVILDLVSAITQGIISKPSFSVWPLLNDDLITVVNGEFQVKQVDGMVKDKMGDLVQRVAQWFDGSHWDEPTMLAFSSVDQVAFAESAFKAAGLPVVSVVGNTRNRGDAFTRVISRSALLLQIKVVGEGVDLPLRRLIDLAPTMSPVLWMQRVGRITRPWSSVPEYIACNHNLTRHAYLWHGLIPAEEIRKSQKAWGDDWKPNRRTMARALGLEGFGRFTVSEVPLADGLSGSFYGLQTKDGSDEYGVFLHPVNPEPLFFHRQNIREEKESVIHTLPSGQEIIGKKKIRGRWTRIQSMPDLVGCVSLPPYPLTPGQVDWWKASYGASKYGLDAEAKVNARQFQMLPILKDVRLKIPSL